MVTLHASIAAEHRLGDAVREIKRMLAQHFRDHARDGRDRVRRLRRRSRSRARGCAQGHAGRVPRRMSTGRSGFSRDVRRRRMP